MQETNEIGHREIKAIIFDMDNTLFDFVEAKLRACKAVVNYINQTDEMELIDYFLKDKFDIENLDSIARYLKDLGVQSNDTFKHCCEIYNKVKLDTIKCYAGVDETLKRLSKTELKLAVVTDAFSENAMARLEKAKLAQYFNLIVTCEITGKKKPEPDPMSYVLEKFELHPQNVMLIGDSLRRDIEVGSELGLTTVYAVYGDRNFHEDRDCHADFVINEIKEVIKILEEEFNIEIPNQ